jgi:hypothetical protein
MFTGQIALPVGNSRMPENNRINRVLLINKAIAKGK